MSQPMQTDSAVLQQQAEALSTISAEFQSTVRQTDSTAGELGTHMTGAAGSALQTALANFNNAALAQINLLTEIGDTVKQSGLKYSSVADQQASSISSVNVGF